MSSLLPIDQSFCSCSESLVDENQPTHKDHDGEKLVSVGAKNQRSQLLEKDVSDSILFIEEHQSTSLLTLDYSHTRAQSNVTHIYNPLTYAAIPHCKYVKRYGSSNKKVLFLGMNPGPYGMAQTGVPFGEISYARDWLGISGEVVKPVNMHPKRPIEGFSCTRSEVSGARFWGLVKTLCNGDPNSFFRNCYVHNYCPLCFMSITGKNITPPMFKIAVRTQFHDICDRSLLQIIELLHIEVIVAVGKYVESRANETLQDFTKWKVKVCSIMHPSPINPASNKGNWEQLVIQQLKEFNVYELIKTIE